MKRIATIVENGKVTGLVHGPDVIGQKVVIHGKAWWFDFDERFGPLWTSPKGEPHKNQDPPSAVWSAFADWLNEHRKKNPK